jgi:hypothetical protein
MGMFSREGRPSDLNWVGKREGWPWDWGWFGEGDGRMGVEERRMGWERAIKGMADRRRGITGLRWVG